MVHHSVSENTLFHEIKDPSLEDVPINNKNLPPQHRESE